MLNLNCVICAELFTPSDNVQVTTCGHLFHISCLAQWLQRSKTCPQCRNKCNDRNIFRVYFNMANLNESRVDLGSLTEQLDNVNLQLKVKEKNCNKFEEDVKSLKQAQKKCMKTMLSMEAQIKKNDFIILNLTDRNKVLASEAKIVGDLRQEIKSLKNQIEMMEGVSTLLTATSADADKVLKTEGDPKKLAVWVATLKRELRQAEQKKTDLRNMLKVVQTDLRKANELKRSNDERISQLESENYQLTEKLKTIDIKTPSANTTIGLNSNLLSNLMFDDRRLTISPATKAHVKKIEESNSPYFNIAASSVGMMPMRFKNVPLSPIKKEGISLLPRSDTGALRKTKSDMVIDKYSIFKKPRIAHTVSAAHTARTSSFMKPLRPNFAFNGFGGSERVDPFAHNSSDDEATEADNEKESERRAQNLKQRVKSGGLRNFKAK